MARCKNCGNMFESIGDWQKICKDCYKKKKQEEIIDYQSQISKLKNEIAYLKMSQYDTSIDNKKIDEKFLKQLINLCHPDKHDNSTMSNDITIKLIKMLKDKRW